MPGIGLCADCDVVATLEEVGDGTAHCQTVGVGADIVEDGLEVALVGYDLVVETLLEEARYARCSIDGIFEAGYVEAELFGKHSGHIQQQMHMVGHHHILLGFERGMDFGDAVGCVSYYFAGLRPMGEG